MAGIDQTVVLGLAGKVEQVFAKAGNYLAFPTGPIGFKADSLRSLISDPLSTAGAQAHATYSIVVNEIPNGPVWEPSGHLLWDVYGDLLSSVMVELIERPRTKSEEQAYDKAFALLYADGPEGVPVPSKAVIAYERYRDAFIAASMEYNNRKGEAELSDEGAVKKAWADDEPGLRAAVEDAEVNWKGPGRRADIDAARQVLSDYGSNSPAMVWEGFRKLFNPATPEIFFRTAEPLVYVPTGYLPSDVVDVSWPRITVTADELPRLAQQAPEELRNKLKGGGDSGIDLVSFEYSYVTVSRSWFTPDLFASRAWRFRDRGRILSDGGSPPKGECTAFVTGLVLARNITVQRKQTVDSEPPNLAFLPTEVAVRDHRIARPYTVSDLNLRTSVWNAGGLRVVGTTTTATPPSAGTGKLTERMGPVLSPGAAERLRVASQFSSLREAPLKASPARPAPKHEVTTETTDPSEIFVLALQCKLLPTSPDPEQPAPGEVKQYVVVKGDTLAKIADRFYGDRSKWPRIYDANRKVIGKDPTLIKPGQTLTIP